MILQADGISFGYEHNAPLIADWDHTFREGELIALTGPSGRGKSTLLYILGLMLQPTSGQIVIDGNIGSSLSDSERAWLRATMFGFVFQDAALDASRTVLDNVTETALYRGLPRRALHIRALSLLEEFGVSLRADARPTQVSGGQAQRIALCRALVNQPKVLLADEPTGNLDAASRDVVVGALRAQADQGSAVIIVTHDDYIADKCDTVISL